MSQLPTTPLISSSGMPSHAGQTVRVIGKITSIAGSQVHIQTSDQGLVEVVLNRETELHPEGYVEVVGKVSEDGSTLREFSCVHFGHDIDMKLVDEVVSLSPNFPRLFTDESAMQH
ncbi:RPA3 [Ceraceosorus bombacis]|uniref:RPA3 n=2 Tax=Ceraceosorus TaxID=401624 RepID=A0A0P1BC19_9BASI|nr:replication factor A protein 3 [Ceraceosorus guamensis]PWN45793.1 replication factor A protein 3 [Ceraceosorus guamensis]CEH12831.1 RPA3 [Ceraceosorus bombacis]